MTVLANSGSGGTNGVPVTTGNSGGTGNTSFDAVSDGTNTSVDWTSANIRPSQALGIVFGAAATAGQPGYVEWSTALVGSGGTGGALNAGAYVHWATPPPSGTTTPLFRGLLTANQRWRVGLTPAGLVVINNEGNTQIGASSALTAGNLYWIEVQATGVNSPPGGTIEVRIHDTAGTLLQTVGPVAAADLGGPVNAIRFGIGASVSPSGSYAFTMSRLMASDAGWIGPESAGPTPAVTLGPVSGAVTDGGFAATWRLSDAAGLDVRLVASTASDLLTSPAYSGVTSVDAYGNVRAAVTGLAADTLYYFGVEVDGVLLADGRGQVRTDPAAGAAASFAVAFTSCQYTVPTMDTFDAIAAYSGPYGAVRRIIHMGDLFYPSPDDGLNATELRAQYAVSLGSAAMAPALAVLPITYEPDNHDWAGTDSHAGSAGAADVPVVYREFWPAYSLPASDGVGMWFSYVIGRVRFIQIDPRSQRDPRTDANGPSKTMLGVEQKAWLKAELQGPEPVKVVQGNMYWRQDALNGDRWGSYADEFDELNDFIDSSAVGLVYVIFGDRHALAADDGSSSGTRGRPQAGGAPAQQGSTASSETWSEGYYDIAPATMQAYGLLEITDAGATITIDYSGVTALDGVTRVAMTTVYDVNQEVAPAGVASGEVVGVPVVGRGPVVVAPAGIAGAAAVGVPVVTSSASVAPTGIGTGAAVGVPVVGAGPVVVSPPGVASGEVVGVPVLAAGAVAVAPPGVGSGEVFGVPVVSAGGSVLTPVGVGSAAAVGVPVVGVGPVVLGPAGIGSGEQVGVPVVAGDGPPPATLVPPGVASGEVFGVPVVAGIAPPGAVLTPVGVGSGEQVGVPVVLVGPTVLLPAGIGSGEVVGVPVVTGGDTGQLIGPVGIPSTEALGRPIVTRMGKGPQMAPCAWTVEMGCYSGWAEMSPELRTRAEQWATEMLWMLSGRQFGACPVTVRPCQACAQLTWQTYGVIWEGGGGSWVPYLRDGVWSNCGCVGSHACRPASEVYLPGPVAGVSEVRVDGAVVDPAAYRVDDGVWLVRTDGGEWPQTQNLSLPAGAFDTFTVTYLRGTPVPAAGRIAAGALAWEFAQACAGSACRLPAQAQSIIRQGVEMQLVAEDSADMLTGVSEADQWIRAVNPGRLRQRPRVSSLDVHTPRVQTWG